MRKLTSVLLALTLAACTHSAPSEPKPATREECYLNVSYVSGNELSRRVWQHIQNAQYDLLDSGDPTFAAALWYTPGDGRAGFVYRLDDCQQARPRVQAVLEQLARSAPSQDIAQALRDGKQSIREVTQAQFEDAEPL